MASLLTSFTKLHITQGTSEIYATNAHSESKTILANHPKSTAFKKWLVRPNINNAGLGEFDFDKAFGVLQFLSEDAKWSFWKDWYEDVLDGKQFDWELMRQVALIADEIWGSGPEAVAKEIKRIQVKFELEQEVKQLKEQLLSLQLITATPQIGDNGGPPLNDPEDIAFQTDLSQIWQRVEELENEIDSPTPSIDKLNAFAVWFQAFFIHAAKYLGAKADIIFTKGCETLGTTGTKALIAYFTVTTAAQNETVHSLPKAILDFIKSLAGG